MPLIFDHTIMNAVDSGDLYALVKELKTSFDAMIHAQDVDDITNTTLDYTVCSKKLIKLIIKRNTEVLDLIDRGRSDTTRREYTRDDNGNIVLYKKES